MKVAIIGAGNVGSTLASFLILKQICKEIALYDIDLNLAKGKAMDLGQMAAILDMDTRVKFASNFDEMANFDIFVITAGLARKGDESREDLLKINAKIVAQCSKEIAIVAPNSIIIVVTNPLDEMVYVALNESKFNPKKVVGMAGELDSGRFKYEISKAFNLNPSQIKAKSVGLHNSSMIFPKSCVNLKHNSSEISQTSLNNVEFLAKQGGASIVSLLKTSAYYAPAVGVVKMIEEICGLRDEILSCSVLGDDGYVYGRLVRLDKDGVCEIKEPFLSCQESDILENSLLKMDKNLEILRLVLK